MRAPSDQLSQQRLVRELRSAMDALGSRPTHPPFFVPPKADSRRALGRLERLITENPRAVRSTHVRYNLGRRRVEMLDALIGHFAAGHSDTTARSDGDSEDGE